MSRPTTSSTRVQQSPGLRWGVLGAAKIADRYVIPAMKSVGDTATALASRSPEPRTQLASRHGIQNHCTDYERVLQNDAVDAVYIALPNTRHVSWAQAALEAGKHVLVEKPLLASPEQAAELVRTAETRGLVVAEGFMYRHHPQWRTLLELLQEDQADGVSLVRGHIGYRHTDAADAVRMAPELGGGSLLDVGCYCLDAIGQILGRAQHCLTRTTARTSSGVDARTVGLLEFSGGRAALFDCDFLLEWTTTPLELRTQNRTITLDQAFNPGLGGVDIRVETVGRPARHVAVAGANAYEAMLSGFSNAAANPDGSWARRETEALLTQAHNMALAMNVRSTIDGG